MCLEAETVLDIPFMGVASFAGDVGEGTSHVAMTWSSEGRLRPLTAYITILNKGLSQKLGIFGAS